MLHGTLTINYKNLDYEIETCTAISVPPPPPPPINYKNLDYEIETRSRCARWCRKARSRSTIRISITRLKLFVIVFIETLIMAINYKNLDYEIETQDNSQFAQDSGF